MKNLIESSKFFFSKSQHYILGNWTEYQEFWQFVPNVGYQLNKRLLKYYLGFIPAYFKFMYLTLKNK